MTREEIHFSKEYQFLAYSDGHKEIILIIRMPYNCKSFPGGSDGKESACGQETWVQSLGREDSPGEGNGNPLQCSSLGNPIDRGAWWAIVHGVAKDLEMT